MSNYSFSNQFYQHWTCAPDPVRSAIVQELIDITDLLQTETPFESFVFSTHDLDAHLDGLYKTHDIEQAAAKQVADKQKTDRATAELQRLEQDRLEAKKKAQTETETKNAQSKLAKDAKQTASEENPTELIANETNKTVDKVSEKSTSQLASAVNDDDILDENSIKVIDNKTHAHKSINLSLKDSKLTATQQQLIDELEVHIDDYLMEQMMQMSDNLKSWLRAEVSRQVNEEESMIDSANK